MTRGDGSAISDGNRMIESDLHRDLMVALIDTLRRRYEDRDDVYVSGNLLVFHTPGDKRRHVSPDVFVVRGVPKHSRDNYLIWEEGRGPEVVIELTSSSTRREDTGPKLELYRDVIGVREYFLFDPREDYLEPSMQGHRLRGGRYVTIRPVEGRLPSQVLGVHLERDGEQLRLFDPATGEHLMTRAEAAEAELARLRARLGDPD